VPGPGTYPPVPQKVVQDKNGDAHYENDNSVPIAQSPEPHPPIPNFKICKPSEDTKQHRDWVEMTQIKNPVGPNSYTP